MEKLSMEELRQMVEDGDLNLNEYKQLFQQARNRPTTLSDDQLLACVGNFDDDYRGEDAAKLIEAAEATI